MTEVISAHELLRFLGRQAALPLRDASSTPGGVIVSLDDHEQGVTWALIYYLDGRTEHCLLHGPVDDHGWGTVRSIRRDISPELAERIVRAHVGAIIAALRKGLALREDLNAAHEIEDDRRCQLMRGQIQHLEGFR